MGAGCMSVIASSGVGSGGSGLGCGDVGCVEVLVMDIDAGKFKGVCMPRHRQSSLRSWS